MPEDARDIETVRDLAKRYAEIAARRTLQENDFQRGGCFEYPTANGKYVIDFDGYPTIEFVPEGQP